MRNTSTTTNQTRNNNITHFNQLQPRAVLRRPPSTIAESIDEISNADYLASRYSHDEYPHNHNHENEYENEEDPSASSRGGETRVSLEDNYSRAMNRMNRGGDFNPNFEQQQQQQQKQQQQFRGGKGNENRTSRGSSNSNSNSNKSSSNGKGNHDRRSNNTTNTNSSSGKGNHDRFSSRRSGSISADGGNGGGDGGISGGNNRTSQRRGSNSRSTQRTSTAGSKQSNGGASRMSRGSTKSRGSTNTNNTRTSNSTSNSTSNDNNNSAIIVPKDMNKMMKMKMKKKTVSQKEPSEEIIAIFGAYGVTGHHFVKFAIEAGYQIRVLMLPGMEKMNDDDLFSSNTCYSVTVITGSFEEEDKIRQVVEKATYVVCLLNDCGEYDPHQQENLRPPVGNIDNHNYNNNPDNNDDYSSSSPCSLNLNFMHNLVPILEESDSCRVLLYQASSVALDEKGTAPMLSKMVKTLAVRKNWRDMKREQDKIVQYIVNQTKQTPFNYIITRPNESMIRDKASRKELAASKSQPGPFPITNIDLAEFTLGALRMKKVYNSCPYVV